MNNLNSIWYNNDILNRNYMYPDYYNDYRNYCISMNQVDLIKQMNLVWEQHIMWTRMLLISIASSLNDLEATKARLLENPKDIANAFKKYYGNTIADTIQRLLTEHLVIGGDLMVALKNGNQKLASELNDKWYKNADDISDAFSSINPFYPREQIRKMLYDHLELTTSEVDARLKGNYSADIKAYDMVQKEILLMSQFFVDGIVMQFPNLF